MVVVAVVLTIALLLVLDHFVRRAAADRERALDTAPRAVHDLDVVPADVFLAPGHVWVRLCRSGAVRVGADGLATTLLGGVDRIDAPAAGRKVRKGEPVVAIHRSGRTVRLPAPVNGVLGVVNPRLASDPSRTKASPFDEGWLYEIWPTGLAAALKRMHVAEDATAWMRQELRRIRDFVMAGEAGRALAPTLADGGPPIDGLARRLSDRRFKRLVSRFFETGS